MKSFGIPEIIHEYAVVHSDGDPVAERLARATQERFADRAMMNIGHDQGRFMQMLVDTYLDTAMEAWTEAGVADRIDMRIGPAADGLATLPDEPHIDLAFIDADKVGYRTYLDLLLPRLSERGAILVDNVLWSGAVVDPDDTSRDTVALREFNGHVAERDDLDAVILTVGDGITMIRPRTAPGARA